MNKTAILSFIIDEVALKCRNVSTNMRKRIHWMLKEMKITVRKYDERALVFNGWVRVREWGDISEIEKMKKGVSNYRLKTQKQLDKLVTLNNEVRCHSIDFTHITPTAPIEVESIENLRIDQDNYNAYLKCSFNKVTYLELKQLSTDQIKLILTRCKRIEKLGIRYSSLNSIDFSQFRIKSFFFDSGSFKEPIYLPKEIEELIVIESESPNLIKARKVNRIYFCCDIVDPSQFVKLTKTLKGVKVVEIEDPPEEYLTCLPSTIRDIYKFWSDEGNSKAIMNQFPYLIEIIELFPIEPTDKSKIRAIEPKLEETQEKFNLRPRKITVTYYNATQLNNHPELFEKVEWAYIKTNEFNFDVLPSKIKKIEIGNRVDLESITLNRLEKKR